MLNMIRFEDRDPTGFCNSEPDPVRTGFQKKSTGPVMNIQTALIAAVKCSIREFFGHKPDWIKLFGQHYWIKIGLDNTMKTLDWIRMAKHSDLFNTTEQW